VRLLPSSRYFTPLAFKCTFSATLSQNQTRHMQFQSQQDTALLSSGTRGILSTGSRTRWSSTQLPLREPSVLHKHDKHDKLNSRAMVTPELGNPLNCSPGSVHRQNDGTVCTYRLVQTRLTVNWRDQRDYNAGSPFGAQW
jgi:hypothetical protein